MNNIQELISKIQNERNTGDKEIHDAEGLVRLQEVMAAYNGEHKLIWSDDLLKEIQARPRVESHKTGLDRLDELTGGFREQQLVTISAHSKHGKTSMGLFLMERMEYMAPVMIPLEQSNEELVQQRFDNGYSIPRFLSPSKLAAQVTVDWIEERIVEGIAKHNTKLVLIDHLGYIDDLGGDGRYKKENLAYRIEMIMKGLKNLAKKWNVVVFLLVHISQADEAKPPTLQDLKGSSSILQESDKVLMLWRKSTLKKKVRVYENKTMISVLANRQTGKNGNIGLEFDTATGKYKENHGWVESLEAAAWQEVHTEGEFDDYENDR